MPLEGTQNAGIERTTQSFPRVKATSSFAAPVERLDFSIFHDGFIANIPLPKTLAFRVVVGVIRWSHINASG